MGNCKAPFVSLFQESSLGNDFHGNNGVVFFGIRRCVGEYAEESGKKRKGRVHREAEMAPQGKVIEKLYFCRSKWYAWTLIKSYDENLNAFPTRREAIPNFGRMQSAL